MPSEGINMVLFKDLNEEEKCKVKEIEGELCKWLSFSKIDARPICSGKTLDGKRIIEITISEYNGKIEMEWYLFRRLSGEMLFYRLHNSIVDPEEK